MRYKTNPFSAVLTLDLALLLAISLAACSPKNAGTNLRTSPQSSAVLEKAKTMKLSTAQFDGLPLAAVIAMLHDESVRLDTARNGVAISLGPDAQTLANAQINLKEIKDVTLAEILGRVADSVGLDVQADDTELILVRKKAKP